MLIRILLSRYLTKLFILASISVVLACSINLSNPESPVWGYCTTEGEAPQIYFDSDRIDARNMGISSWSDCKIIDIRKTDKAGKEYDRGFIVHPDDMEIIIEVVMDSKNIGKFKTRFWYLVRNFNGVWKITSYSHIPDQYIPDYD